MRRHNNFHRIRHKSSETHESKQALKDGKVDSEAWTCAWSSVLRSTAGTKTTLSHHIKAIFFWGQSSSECCSVSGNISLWGEKKSCKRPASIPPVQTRHFCRCVRCRWGLHCVALRLSIPGLVDKVKNLKKKGGGETHLMRKKKRGNKNRGLN